MGKTHAHTQATGVNSHCKESSYSTGSHGIPAGEAESTYFWNLQMEEQKQLENVREGLRRNVQGGLNENGK